MFYSFSQNKPVFLSFRFCFRSNSLPCSILNISGRLQLQRYCQHCLMMLEFIVFPFLCFGYFGNLLRFYLIFGSIFQKDMIEQQLNHEQIQLMIIHLSLSLQLQYHLSQVILYVQRMPFEAIVISQVFHLIKLIIVGFSFFEFLMLLFLSRCCWLCSFY